MKSPPKRRLYLGLLIFFGSTVLAISMVMGLHSYIEDSIQEKILSINGRTSSIHVNLFARSVKIKDLWWSTAMDSISPHQHLFRLNSITAKDISLYELIVNKTLEIGEVIIDSGRVQYNLSVARPRLNKSSHSLYHVFSSRSISFKNVALHIATDTTETYSALLNCRLTDAVIKLDSVPEIVYTAKTIDILLEKISLYRHAGMYGGTIARLHLNTQDGIITIDSALLIPNFSKYEFAHYWGSQTNRVNLSIPQIMLEGIQFEKIADSSLIASKITIKSFDLVAFRDTRTLFKRKDNMPLPMVVFLKFPWHVKIDSICIADSRINVEVFPENGNTSGVITFNSINATFTGLNNRIQGKEQRFALLEVNGLLMDTGRIKTLFTFPLDGSLTYHARGSISEISFAKINPMLSPMAHVRVKSGYLNNLAFNFNYTDLVSNGHIDIDYRDLYLTSLHEDHSTNQGKTFFMNVFLKNNKQQAWSSARRTGVIDIERDRKHFIFNVWWKSISDGLKSSFRGGSEHRP